MAILSAIFNLNNGDSCTWAGKSCELRKTRRKLELLQCSTVNFQNQEILVRQDALDAPGLTSSLS